jgi:peptidoglycan/LPS O-acetylase OafA/YrhL
MGLPLPSVFTDGKSKYLTDFGKLAGLIFNGPAAVIVFFIISGFVIHLPFKDDYNKLNIKKFYIRRLTRISVPAIVIVFLYRLFNVELTPPQFGTLWSIICEVIYYVSYPLLLVFFKMIRIKYLVAGTYILSLALLLLNLDSLRAAQNSYTALGYLTFLVGLPCWLMGCWLAENYNKFKEPSRLKMLFWRLIIILVAFGLRIVKFHVAGVIASNCFTLNLFAFLATYWLALEINFYINKMPNKMLEYSGKWSYSLYLIHPLVLPILLYFGLTTRFVNLHYFVIIISCVLAYVYYLLIEKPSHKIAEKLSNMVVK